MFLSKIRLCVCLCCIVFTLTAGAWAQTSATPRNQAEYILGPGDVVEIKVADAPELSGKFRVTEGGNVSLPLLSTPIKAAGLTALDVSKNIAQAVKAADILREPAVTVFVEQYRSRSVTVLGAVAKPGVYPMERRTTVLELLSMAGGALPTAGSSATITRKAAAPAESGSAGTPEAGETTISVDLSKLTTGRDMSQNWEVEPGDILNVPTAPIVYVVGAVNKPGGFALQDPRSGLTVLQAIALVEGFKPAASPGHTIILRNSTSEKERKEVPVDLNKLMAGKLKDSVLEANDILFIPESGFKKGARKLGDAALSAASTIVGYGYGLRVAPHR